MIKLGVLFFMNFFLMGALAKAEAPPQKFDKESFTYTVIKKVAFDADQTIKELGLRIHSCKIQAGGREYAFPSLGNCLLVAINSSIKNQNFSAIKLWVLNEKGEYLPPLVINWRVAQKNWFKFIFEFVELSFEDFFKFFRKKNSSANPCVLVPGDFLTKDIGNFLGDLEIRAEAPWKLSDYFTSTVLFKSQQFGNANGLEINMKSPEFIDGKKIYELRMVLNNNIETNFTNHSIVMNIRSNYNFVVNRDSCINGNLEWLTPQGVNP